MNRRHRHEEETEERTMESQPVRAPSRHYSVQERTEAIALAASVGPREAGRKLYIPHRTISNWMHKPDAVPIRAEIAAAIEDRLRRATDLALASVVDGLSDPKARLGDRARALEVLATQRNLAEGRVTARTESANLNIGLDLAGVGDAEIATLQAQLQVALGEDPVPALLDALRHLTPEQRDRLASSLDGIAS